jgi:hypothetical protein
MRSRTKSAAKGTFKLSMGRAFRDYLKAAAYHFQSFSISPSL